MRPDDAAAGAVDALYTVIARVGSGSGPILAVPSNANITIDYVTVQGANGTSGHGVLCSAATLTLRIRRGYSMSAERIADGAQNNFAPGFDHAAYFLGVGDHGGAVTR